MLPFWLALAFLGTVTAQVWPYQEFNSSTFQPPILNITKSGAPLQDGLLIFDQQDAFGQHTNGEYPTAVLIMNDDGELIWNGPTTAVTNLQVTTYKNQTVLTYWTGSFVTANSFYGSLKIVDSSYNTIKTFCPTLNVVSPDGIKYNCTLDVHEQYLTDWGTVVTSLVNVTNANLSSVGGPEEGWIYDAKFYEFDLETEEVLFEWSAGEHIPLNSTHVPFPTDGVGNSSDNPWPWFHINSIQSISQNGRYLINGRYVCGTYMINQVGDVEWWVGGISGGNFTLPADGGFSYAHEARIMNQTDTSAIIHWYDNANSPYTNAAGEKYPSSGLILNISFTDWNATLVQRFQDPTDLEGTVAEGSFEPQANGNWLAGFGTIPVFKEFGPDGDVRMDIRSGTNNLVYAYRIHRYPWVGNPTYPPNLVVKNETAYFSWNGATEVASWKVYTGSDSASLGLLGEVNKTGFETSFALSTVDGFAQVGAFAGNGTLLGNSAVVEISSGSSPGPGPNGTAPSASMSSSSASPTATGSATSLTASSTASSTASATASSTGAASGFDAPGLSVLCVVVAGLALLLNV